MAKDMHGMHAQSRVDGRLDWIGCGMRSPGSLCTFHAFQWFCKHNLLQCSGIVTAPRAVTDVDRGAATVTSPGIHFAMPCVSDAGWISTATIGGQCNQSAISMIR